MSEKWENGDIITNGTEKRKILEVFKFVVVMSMVKDHDRVAETCTQAEVEKRGWSKEEPLFEGYVNKYKNGVIDIHATKGSAEVHLGDNGKTIKVREVKD